MQEWRWRNSGKSNSENEGTEIKTTMETKELRNEQ